MTSSGHRVTAKYDTLRQFGAAEAALSSMVSINHKRYSLFACNGILFNEEFGLRPARIVTKKIAAAADRMAPGNLEALQLGNREVQRDWDSAPEYVDAMWRMFQQEKGEDYVVTTGHLGSVEEFVVTALENAGFDWGGGVKSSPCRRPADVRGFVSDARRRAAGWVAIVTQ